VYVERIASPEIRAQAQGFLVQMTLGVGMFIGMILTGKGLFNSMVADVADTTERMQAYQDFWAIPAVIAAVVMIVFALLFRDSRRPAEEVSEPEVAHAAAELTDTDSLEAERPAPPEEQP